MLEKAMEQAKEKYGKFNEGDYIKDGLLYCGKCKTRKQTRLKLFEKTIEPYCMCKCEEREYNRRKLEEKKDEIRARVKEYAFTDNEVKECNFEKDDKKNKDVTKIAKRYVDYFKNMFKDGRGIMFYGGVGTGKTFMAGCIVNELLDKGYSCLVTSFSRIVNNLTDNFNKQQFLDDLNKFDLLVIDDMSAERDTEYMNEVVYNIIDNRYRSKRPLIITTNLTEQELTNPQNVAKHRIYSRILDMCYPVEVNGVDRRNKNFKTRKQEFEKITDGGKEWTITQEKY